MAGQEHYSLRWNNHQSHILRAFDLHLQQETLVDVTLVCETSSVRAHKVVLSACSPFFQRIFSETPCKHPVIVLKDFQGWEVQAIVDFMYRGEIRVRQERLRTLIRVGESLQVRGLVDHPMSGPTGACSDDFEMSPSPSLSVHEHFEPPVKLPHMIPLAFTESSLQGPCPSPLPRRKQARPRRRSGDCGPQDLSKPSSPFPTQQQQHQVLQALAHETQQEMKQQKQQEQQEEEQEQEQEQEEQHEEAENLCVKKPVISLKDVRKERTLPPVRMGHMQLSPPHLLKMEALEDCSEQLDLSMPSMPSMDKDYMSSPPLGLPHPGLLQHHDIHSHSPLPFPPMPTGLTPPHIFGLDSPLGLFPPGMDPGKLYQPLLDLDPRGPAGHDTPPFGKKKLGRPKGQHSAPRGGPPRSWTNAELTEALQHVWNKKMTTSQASRIFGIPYNSLLMYVRGKYGKSLKLEQLRKDCISGPPIELLNMSGNNNNSKASLKDEILVPGHRPSSSEPDLMASPNAMFNPFSPGFYPDFTGFPLPLLHLMPPSERHPGREPLGLDMLGKEEDMKRKDEEEDKYSPLSLSRDDRRELIQHNGQD